MTVEVPPATRDTSTPLTPGISVSSSVTDETQWPQVMPSTCRVTLLAVAGASVGRAVMVRPSFEAVPHPQLQPDSLLM